jgi:hypothetical protein
MKKMTGGTADPVFFVKRHIRRNGKWRNNGYGMTELTVSLLRFTGISPMAPQADILDIDMKTQPPSSERQDHMAIQAPDLRIIMGTGGKQG